MWCRTKAWKPVHSTVASNQRKAPRQKACLFNSGIRPGMLLFRRLCICTQLKIEYVCDCLEGKHTRAGHRPFEETGSACKGYGSLQSAWRTLQGIETMQRSSSVAGRLNAFGPAYVVAAASAAPDALRTSVPIDCREVSRCVPLQYSSRSHIIAIDGACRTLIRFRAIPPDQRRTRRQKRRNRRLLPRFRVQNIKRCGNSVHRLNSTPWSMSMTISFGFTAMGVGFPSPS